MILLDESAGDDQFVAVFIFEIHVRRLCFVASLLDLKNRADHMGRRDVIFDGRVCHDRAGGGALRAADHIDREVVLIQVPDQLRHRKVHVVNVPHIVEAGGIFLAELDGIIVEFFNGHAGVSFGEVPCKGFIGKVSGLDGSGDLL